MAPKILWRLYFSLNEVTGKIIMSFIEIIIFVFGLIVGSFLNAVIYRLHSGKSFLFDRSECPHCHHKISAKDLFPLFSFILLGGKCRYCKKNISWQYPIIELATGLVFILLARDFQFEIFNFQFLIQLFFASIFIIVAVFDLKHYLILDKVVLPAAAIALIYSFFAGNYVSAILSGLGFGGFFLFQYLISKGRWIGFGDVKFGLLLGLVLTWPLSLICLLLAYYAGAIVGIGLIAAGKKNFGSKLPFGTFLGFSGIITMLFGSGLVETYFKLLGL